MDAMFLHLSSLMMEMIKSISCKSLIILKDTQESTFIKKEWFGRMSMKWSLICFLTSKVTEKKFTTKSCLQTSMIHLALHVIVTKNSANSVFLNSLKELYQNQVFTLWLTLWSIRPLTNLILRLFIWFKTTLKLLLNSHPSLMDTNARK